MDVSSRALRRRFLQYFAERDHATPGSGPLVPANDPTLMFANAGMVPFKDVFTGKDRRDYRRATTSQKCIRISGKHNDLENVGQTARHHTFFEMLGNFSFGDYFKKDAIAFAWELLVQELGIPRDRLVVTVFGGEEGLPADDEAERLWRETADLEPSRVIRCGAADNFWSMGDTGPCGPCSEIHYWVGTEEPDVSRFGEENRADGTGWTEIWNLVFMQFDRQEGGALDDLPAPSIDTGMGLERLAAVLQHKHSNYDTDLLRPLVDQASELSGKPYGGSLLPDDVSMRVIADHARTTAFLIAEGVFPDRGDREYVLRRVMRRAVRHGHRLGITEPFLHRVADRVVDLMGDDYPELPERRDLIADITQQEEERFRQTLERGLALIAGNDDWATAEGGGRILPGQVAFKLYDTFGFPLDLQDVIGTEQGFAVDHAGFDAALAEARLRSQGSKVGEQAVDDVYRRLREELGEVRFLGYEREEGEAPIAALLRDGARVQALRAGDAGELVAPETPFYGESGGQVGDRGRVLVGDAIFQVEGTHKPVDGLFVHRGRVEVGAIEAGALGRFTVDHDARSATRRNHSATHLLHWALREVLGPSAMQKGSLVGPDRLRFDYASARPLTPDEIRRIEDLVNGAVLANTPVTTEVLSMDEAKARGAIGIFEEKYGDVVRMLRIGPSLELCGGTHAARTGDIGLFKVLSDAGVAAGVRRLEAATGGNAAGYVRELETQMGELVSLLKASSRHELGDKVERLLTQQKVREKEITDLQKQLASGGGRDLTAEARRLDDGARVLGLVVPIGDPKALREMADQLRDKLDPAVVLLGTQGKDGKALLACSVSKSLVGRFKAGEIVKDAAAVVGGGGGGRPDFAQAGGSDPSKLPDAVDRVYALTGAPPAAASSSSSSS
ncbi:MAG TPA: alanine--tRNA ligase [Polyangiaceae bacterium LLY-WYZ-14_1]|nr:alanine--tRNA ligase [Polyangiaceae bacterium LLY-WYZ-14_1]